MYPRDQFRYIRIHLFQIPFSPKIFFVFPNPAPYFGQIPDPENTLLDPVFVSATTLIIWRMMDIKNDDLRQNT